MSGTANDTNDPKPAETPGSWLAWRRGVSPPAWIENRRSAFGVFCVFRGFLSAP